MADERFVSSTASGGGTGTEGDPWTFAEAATNANAFDHVNVKADGTYTLAANWVTTNPGGDWQPIHVQGYGSVPGDGVRPTIACGSSYQLQPGEQWRLHDLSITGSNASALVAPSNNRFIMYDCGVVNSSGPCYVGNGAVIRCFLNSTGTPSYAVSVGSGQLLHSTAKLGGGTGDVVQCANGQVIGNTIDGGGTTGDGVNYTAVTACVCAQNVIHDVGDGVYAAVGPATGVVIGQNVIWTCSGYGLVVVSKYSRFHFMQNAIGDCTSGRASIFDVTEFDPITLTGDPFVDAANGDFRLNDVPGAGRECRHMRLRPPAA